MNINEYFHQTFIFAKISNTLNSYMIKKDVRKILILQKVVSFNLKAKKKHPITQISNIAPKS